MKQCEQTKNLSVLEHGELVHAYYKDLIDHLQNQKELKFCWRIPDWCTEDLLQYLLPTDLVKEYQIYHDCGKPFCKTIVDGKQHFPNHAEISFKIWKEVGGSEEAANLMLMDMDIHLLKPDQVQEFSQREEAVTLLLTGLCELHTNASMFGGICSDNFKIKWKRLNQRGKSIIFKIRER